MTTAERPGATRPHRSAFTHRPVWGPAVGHLVRRGIIAGDAALDGRVSVEAASRSNEVGIVHDGSRPVAVLKRPRLPLDGVDPFAAELAAYRLLAAGGEAPAPRLLDHVDGVLAIDVVDGRPFHEALAASAQPQTLLRSLGAALAEVHDLPTSTELPARRPWVLDVCTVGLPHLLAGDDALVALVDVIAADRALRDALHDGAAAWAEDGFVHGDVKFDNVLVDGHAAVKLVDWELAGRGATVWDLAGIVDGVVVPAIVAGHPHPLEAMGDAEPALDAYRAARGRTVIGHGWSLEAATVARLVQSAIQLTAMRHDDAECQRVADAVLGTAADLATTIPHGARAA